MRSSSLISLPAVDCDKAITAQLCLEAPLLTSQAIYFQVSLLYPSIYQELDELYLCKHVFFNEITVVLLVKSLCSFPVLCLCRFKCNIILHSFTIFILCHDVVDNLELKF